MKINKEIFIIKIIPTFLIFVCIGIFYTLSEFKILNDSDGLIGILLTLILGSLWKEKLEINWDKKNNNPRIYSKEEIKKIEHSEVFIKNYYISNFQLLVYFITSLACIAIAIICIYFNLFGISIATFFLGIYNLRNYYKHFLRKKTVIGISERFIYTRDLGAINKEEIKKIRLNKQPQIRFPWGTNFFLEIFLKTSNSKYADSSTYLNELKDYEILIRELNLSETEN